MITYRQMVDQLTSISISGGQVARFLNYMTEQRGKPDQIICDNGIEFTSKAMFFWQSHSAVRLGFIQPQNRLKMPWWKPLMVSLEMNAWTNTSSGQSKKQVAK